MLGWFFRDKLIFSSKRLDEGSRRLGIALSVIGGIAWWITALWQGIVDNAGPTKVLALHYVFPEISDPVVWFCVSLIGTIGLSVCYRAIRLIIWSPAWVLGGFSKSNQ